MALGLTGLSGEELRSTPISDASPGIGIGTSSGFANGNTHEQLLLWSLSWLWLCLCVVVAAAAVVDSAGAAAMAAVAGALAWLASDANVFGLTALLDCDVDIVALSADAGMLELVLCDNRGKFNVDEIYESHVVASMGNVPVEVSS